MKYKLMTENDLEYVVEKIMNTRQYRRLLLGPMKKPIREFIRYSQWKIPDVNYRNGKYVFRLEKAAKI